MPSLYGQAIGGGLSGNIDANRVTVTDKTKTEFYTGKPLTVFAIDFGVDVSAQFGSNKAVDKIFRIVQKYATIVIRTNFVASSFDRVTLFVETANESADWGGPDDSIAATTLVEYIEDEIRALTNLSGSGEIDYTSVSCTVVTDSFDF